MEEVRYPWRRFSKPVGTREGSYVTHAPHSALRITKKNPGTVNMMMLLNLLELKHTRYKSDIFRDSLCKQMIKVICCFFLPSVIRGNDCVQNNLFYLVND